MKRFLIVEDNGQGMEDVYSLLRERGYSVTECGPESGDTLLFNQYAIDRACVQAFWITHDLRIIYANDAACRTLGYTSEELTRMSVGDIDPDFPGPEHSDFLEHWRELKENGFVKFETSHRARDGRVYPVEIQSNFLEFNGREYNCCYVTDISERKQAEDALLFNQFAIERACVQAFWITHDQRILYVNDAACQSLGYTREELTRMSVGDIAPGFPGPEHPGFLEHWRALKERGVDKFETSHRARDGRVYPVEILVNFLEFNGREFHCCYVTDISDRKLAENALRESEDRLKLAMHMAKLAQWEYDVPTGMTRCDDQLYTLFGTSMDREGGYLMSGDSFIRKFVHPDDIPLVMAVIERSLTNSDGTAITQMDHRIVRADGEERYMSVLWETIRDREGRAVRTRGANQDITEQKRAEKVLFAQQKQLAAMTMELSLAEQRERCRIAAELHDGIGQILTLTRIRLGLLADGVCGKEADKSLADIMELVDSANRRIRSLTGQLAPPILEAAGLDAVLSWLAGKMQTDYGLSVEFQSDNAPRPLSPEIRCILYQAARELLINVVKHAQTDRARLSVKLEGEKLILTVDDHGVGFDAGQFQPVSKEGCFGLFIIQQRLIHLGGEMSIASTPGAGSRIQLRVFLLKTMTKENRI